VSGFALDGSPLPGFPLPGDAALGFADLDNDGSTDLVSASRDGTVYAFSLGKNGGMR
jgi:hypothetical protein